MIKKPKNKQHHGNLREALIEAGLQLLYEEGLEALTLRRCAAIAGVTHAAPSHHFDGLRGLKAAIAVRGYAIFEQLMRDGIASASPDKRAQAIGLCQGYIKFATEHNALFNLVFDRPEKFVHDAEWVKASTSARQVLNDVSSQVASGSDADSTVAIAIFSLVHGYAKLIEIGRVVPGSGDGRDVKFEDIIAMMNFEPIQI